MRKISSDVTHSMNGTCYIPAFLIAVVLFSNTVYGSEFDSQVAYSQGPYTVFAQRKIPLLLNCSTTSSSAQNATARWFKNGILLTPDRHVQIMENGSLYIRNIKRNKRKRRKGRNDEGFYECHLRNRKGTFISRQVHLKVAWIARSFTIEPQDVETRIGGVARFACQIEAVPSVPPSMIIWQKDGQQSPVLDNDRFTMLSLGDLQILQIHDVQLEDEGKYHCATYHRPTISSNPKYSRDATLTVNQNVNNNRAPEILAFSHNASQVRVGESLTLECFVDGKPKPDIRWLKQVKRPLLPGEENRNPTFSPVVFDRFKEIIGNGNLKFNDIHKEDDGIYKCVASSQGFNSVEGTVTVQVIEPPGLLIGPESKVFPMTHVIRLDCLVSGVPKPKVTWYFNGRPKKLKVTHAAVKPEKEHQLVIRDSSIEDSGYYQCIAENVAGSLIATASITVTMTENVPNPPTDVEAVAISATEINVHWKPSQNVDCCKSIWYTVLYQKVGMPDMSQVDSKLPTPPEAINITIRDLQPYTSYRIFVRAYNSKGGGEKSNIRIVRTKEGVPESSPLVTLSNRIPKSIQVQWEWPQSLEKKKNGKIIEYKIYYEDIGGGMKYLEVTGDQSSYTITDLKPETVYKVCVLGRTVVGYPRPTNEMFWSTIKTLPAPTYHPNVSFTCINSTSMRLDWAVDNDTHPELTGYQIMMRKIIGQGQSRNISIEKTRKSHLLSNLETKMHYEIKFLVINQNRTIGMTEDTFYTDCKTDPRPPPPLEIDAKPLPGNKIHLSWQRPKSHQDIKYYTIKYNKVENPHRVTYQRSDTPYYDLENLSAMTWYAVSVRSHLSDIAGPFSNTVHVQTKEDVPSPPEHLSVRSEGDSLIITWQPPASRNGVITYYLVMYNSDKEVPDDKWTCTKVNGSKTTEVLENLPPKRVYYFKVKACNRIGESRASKVIEINICPFECGLDPPEEGITSEIAPPKDHKLGIIIGCSVGLTSIIICVIIVYLRQRHYSRIYRQQHNTQYPNGPFTVVQRNGHVGQYPSNHTDTVTGNHRYNEDPNTPMLTENIHSDTKGPGPGVIFSTNGKIIYLCNSKTKNGKMRALVAEPGGYSAESQEHQALLTTAEKQENSRAIDELQPKDFSDEILANNSGSNVSLSCDPSICSSMRQDNHSHDNSPDFSRAKFERGYKFEDRQDSWDEEHDCNDKDRETGGATSVSAVGPQDIGASGFHIKDSGFHRDNYCHSDDLSEENGDISHNLNPNQEIFDNKKDCSDLLSKMLEATSDYNDDSNINISDSVSPLTSSNTSAASSSLPQSSMSRSPVAMVKKTSTTEASSDQI